MSSPPFQPYSSLQKEYEDMKRRLHQNFIIIILTFTVGLLCFEAIRTAMVSKIDSFLQFGLPLPIFFLTFKHILGTKVYQELKGTILVLSFYAGGLYTNLHGDLGHFASISHSFYFGQTHGIIERIVCEKLSKLEYKIPFTVISTLARTYIVKPPELSLCILQLMFASMCIYSDILQDKHSKHLITSYFAYKEQLTKFKDLVVRDIPEGIAIITQDLHRGLFVNDSFMTLFGGLSSNVRAQLGELSVDKSPDNNILPSSISASRDGLGPQNMQKDTLLSYLESHLRQPSKSLTSSRLSCNLRYTRSHTQSELESSSNSARSDVSNEERVFEAKIFPIVWDEQPSVAIILNEVTQQRTILSLQIADANKDAVLATISHELRTPLNAMLGMIQIVQQRIKDTELLHYLSICNNSANLLLGLVNSILDLNQIRSNKLQLNVEKVHLKSLLRDVISLFELQCEKKGLYIRLNFDESITRVVLTDRSRLSQIFINLVGNALKFTSKGGITITAENDGDFISLGIEDSGVGIKEKDKEKLFKTFGRLEETNQTINKQGVGLGLTIADNLAKLLCDDHHRGGVTMKSVYKEGTRFSFLIKKKLEGTTESANFDCEEFGDDGSGPKDALNNLTARYNFSHAYCSPTLKGGLKAKEIPLTKTISKKDFAISKGASSSSLSFSMLRRKTAPSSVLVVDDNPFNLTVAETLISSLGYNVKAALSGEEAINILTKPGAPEDIRLIFMDCQMPIMDGYQTTKALKKLIQENKIPDIPIVALTANDTESDKVKCLEAGMSDHLGKPIKTEKMKKILERYCRA